MHERKAKIVIKCSVTPQHIPYQKYKDKELVHFVNQGVMSVCFWVGKSSSNANPKGATKFVILFENFRRGGGRIFFVLPSVQGIAFWHTLDDCIIPYRSNKTLYFDYEYRYENVMRLRRG